MAGETEDGVHDNAQANVATVWTCKGCKTKSNNNKRKKVNWIECAGCEDIYETKCQNISEFQYAALQERADILWLCPNCMVVMCPKVGTITKTNLTPDTVEDMEDPNLADVMCQIKLLKNKMDSLDSIQSFMKITMDTLQTDVLENLPTDLKQQMDDKVESTERNINSKMNSIISQLPAAQGRTWSDVLQESAPTPPPMPNITVECLKKAISEVNEGDKEMELRSRGIVVYRAKEHIRTRDETDENEVSMDEALIRRLLTFLECDTDELLSVNRLGSFSAEKIEEGKFRPMKVRFKSSEARDKVLSCLTKLRNAPPELKVLSIRQDLNYSQRQELNAKVQEAREKSRDLTDGVFRVRGSPGSYFLVEVKRRNPFLGQA